MKGDSHAVSLENGSTRGGLVGCCLHHDAERAQRDGVAWRQQEFCPVPH
jgi:hypothetical protein